MTKTETASPALRRRHPFLRVIAWIAGIVLVVLVAVIIIVLFFPNSVFLPLINQQGSSALGRAFHIGHIDVGLNWAKPQFELDNIQLGNTPGASPKNMAEIDRLKFRIRIWHLLEGQLNLPDVEIDKPQITLEKFGPNKTNWNFSTFSKANVAANAALPTKRSNFPIIGSMKIEDGKLTYDDKPGGLNVTAHIDSLSGKNQDKFNLTAKGVLHAKPFEMTAHGGSLWMLRETGKPYPLDLHIAMGHTEITANGTYADPVNLKGVNTELDLRGDNLADLFYLTGIPLPPTPAYSLSGHLLKTGNVWKFENFKGKVGESDLSGDLSYDTTPGKRSFVKATLNSHLLSMTDLRGFIGAKTSATQTAPPANPNQVLPNMPLDLDRLRAADMDVIFAADRINQPGWPIEDMQAHLELKDGLLRIDPLRFGVAHGVIAGVLTLDGRKDIPAVKSDLTLKHLSLKPFFESPTFKSLSAGSFGGIFKVEGHGKSLAAVLADGNGHITLMMQGGSTDKLIVDAIGLDIGHAIPQFLGKSTSAGIRCAIADFGMHNGLLNSDIFVFDTTASHIDGTLNVDLKNETIHASIEGHPKGLTISGQTPITINGPLRSPSIGLGPKSLAARGGAAAALGVVLTPLAAIIPFIDVTPGKNSNCAALIADARKNAGAAVPAR